MLESGPKGHLGVPLAHGEDPIDGNGADLDQGVFGHPKTKPELKIQTCPEHPFGWKSIPETENPRIAEVYRITRKHDIFYPSEGILARASNED